MNKRKPGVQRPVDSSCHGHQTSLGRKRTRGDFVRCEGKVGKLVDIMQERERSRAAELLFVMGDTALERETLQ